VGVSGDHGRIDEYVEAYVADYGFEAVMVHARRREVLAWLTRHQPQVLVEVGVGSELLVDAAAAVGIHVDRWIVVEPAAEFVAHVAERAQMGSTAADHIHVVPTYMEEAVAAVAELGDAPVDAVVCSSLLHEVPQPALLLGAIRQLLPAGGRVHVSVPNATSLHRRLARAMGLIADERVLSDRNIELGQPRVMDAGDLHRLVTESGFVVEEAGGYMLKPFTHAQMAALPFLSDELLEGLDRLGGELPDLAAEVYVNAHVP
jgi:2-polyprenyl-3-methyl-5-hydroxy-6-metoxy-1,4-benzoquinol methylase